VAFIIPLLQVGYLNNLLNNQQEARILSVQVAQVTETSKALTVTDLLIFCYLSIAVFFTVKMAISIYKIILLSFNAKKQKAGKVIYVELNHSHAAFSFFNLLFLNPSVAEKHTILKHEMVHIQQKHSLDIIFFEIIQIIAWFNPVTYFIKKEIKLLHEYIADDITTDNDIQKHDYAMFLIQNSFGIVPNQLANQIFNQSILKRRINMLNKERSTGRARLKLLFALPIAGGMLCASTMAFTKDYAIDLYPEKYESNQSVKQDTSKKKSTELKAVRIKSGAKTKTVKFPPPIVTPDAPPVGKHKKNVDDIKFPPPIIKTVKFPPPIVKPDAPAAPKKAKSLKGVKFPPPIVTPDKPVPPPPPPVEPKKDEAKTTSINGNDENVVVIKIGEQAKAIKGQKVTFTAKDGSKSTVTFETKPTN
jgi:hypothetical protein